GAIFQVDKKKRLGQNTFDLIGRPILIQENPQVTLAYDFDNGQAVNDAFSYPMLGNRKVIDPVGRGVNEAMIAGGDSGGPEFITNNQGQLLIAGITRGGGSLGQPPDIDDKPFNASFGEYGLGVRVSQVINDF